MPKIFTDMLKLLTVHTSLYNEESSKLPQERVEFAAPPPPRPIHAKYGPILALSSRRILPWFCSAGESDAAFLLPLRLLHE